MPGFDRTGPRGQGPMTGRGEGYGAQNPSSPETGGRAYGYTGRQGTPMRLGRLRLAMRRGRGFGRGRGRDARRGRGRRFTRW